MSVGKKRILFRKLINKEPLYTEANLASFFFLNIKTLTILFSKTISKTKTSKFNFFRGRSLVLIDRR